MGIFNTFMNTMVTAMVTMVTSKKFEMWIGLMVASQLLQVINVSLENSLNILKLS